MTENNTLVSSQDFLPALAEQSKKIDELKAMIDDIQVSKQNSPSPMQMMDVDFRKLDTFLILQQTYYGIFARNKEALELVPFEIIQKADKWALKMFKKDLKNQVDKNYKQLLIKEKRNKRKKKLKGFFSRLFKRNKK